MPQTNGTLGAQFMLFLGDFIYVNRRAPPLGKQRRRLPQKLPPGVRLA